VETINIYLCGVGGQGIGLLSEVMIRSCMAADHNVMGADTHGLAQRGGTVVSHLRLGDSVYTPLVPAGKADVVIALERVEALRGMLKMIRPGGTLIYYNTAYQPISVRTGQDKYPSELEVEAAAEKLGATVVRVCLDDMPDPRMQNVALLGKIASLNLIAGLNREVIGQTLESVVPPKVIKANREVFARAFEQG
jgi:indolepyruvate ferredoxin oxidoreductase, beta subunit